MTNVSSSDIELPLSITDSETVSKTFHFPFSSQKVIPLKQFYFIKKGCSANHGTISLYRDFPAKIAPASIKHPTPFYIS